LTRVGVFFSAGSNTRQKNRKPVNQKKEVIPESSKKIAKKPK